MDFGKIKATQWLRASGWGLMLAISASPSLAQDFPARQEEAICKTVNSPEFMKQGATLGFLPALPPSADFGKTIAMEDVELSKVMEKAGLKKQ